MSVVKVMKNSSSASQSRVYNLAYKNSTFLFIYYLKIINFTGIRSYLVRHINYRKKHSGEEARIPDISPNVCEVQKTVIGQFGGLW